MRYSFNDNNTFTATLDYTGEECEPLRCEEQHPGLSACETKIISMSHFSCEPPLEYPLEVPPGKCRLLSVCVFTTTARFCVWIVARRGEGKLAWGGGGAGCPPDPEKW